MTDNELKNLIANAVGDKLKELFGGMVSESKYTLFGWLDYWYTEFKEKANPPLSGNGLYQIRNCIDKHIKGNMRDIPLSELTALDCKEWISKISSSRMAVYAYDTLNDSLNCAVTYEEIKKNPLAKVQKPKHKREKKMPLTKEQEYNFLKYIRGSRLENLFRFYLASGVRKAEALAIKWTDIDEQRGTLFVNGTKTETSKRYIPLFDSIRRILAKQPHLSEYVFPYADYTVKNAWRWLCKKHEDINYTIHSLRHTFATRCYELRIADKVIQKWLGHSKVSTTQNIYIDVLADFEKAAVNTVNNAKVNKGQKREFSGCPAEE
ncbi:MAG: site-specific integrase [Roseburia sp.]|nr:site-specific integrase [Roseburia sp.]